MNKDNISVHVFLYYESSGKYVIDRLSKIYSGDIYLSLVEDNCSNDILKNYAQQYFNVKLLYIDNYGTDQYGFYNTFKFDDTNKPWIFYCHDKHPSKMDWLIDMMTTFDNMDETILNYDKVGMIASTKHKNIVPSFEHILLTHSMDNYEHRKNVVETMHTLIWLHELERILLAKYNIGDKNFKYPTYSGGNVFLIRRPVLEKAHGCIYSNYFNKNTYRADGEVEHGLERFYFYVSSCMGYNNIFI